MNVAAYSRSRNVAARVDAACVDGAVVALADAVIRTQRAAGRHKAGIAAHAEVGTGRDPIDAAAKCRDARLRAQ